LISCQDFDQNEPVLISNQNVVIFTSQIANKNDSVTSKDSVISKDTVSTVVIPPPPTIPPPTPPTITNTIIPTITTTNKTSSPYSISDPIIWNGVSDKTISHLEISNLKGASIELINCKNIRIEYCKLGPSKGEGVTLYNCTNITVENCYMESISTGVSAVESFAIKVNYNDVKNVMGPFPRGQMVQFDEVTGSGSSISYNVCENIAGQSHPEDAISLFKSHGTANDPIKVIGNWIRGGGPSISGGGIILGDYGGSYINVENNILVDAGQYGIAITAGNNLTIKNNKIYSRKQSFTFWGLMSYIQYSNPTYSNTIMNNQVNFTNKDGVLRNLWDDGKAGEISGWSSNIYNSNLNATILPSIILGKAATKAFETKSI